MAAIHNTVNRVVGIYETELAVTMLLVTNNDQIVYTDGAADPYTNDDASAMLGENQANVDSVIGNDNYDIGHVFSTGGGGLAGLGVVCTDDEKAMGVTGSDSPTGDPFDVDYVAHEMGHQFGANHTFNGAQGACTDNRNASTAYEPGSGSTIMGYAGICETDDLQANTDAYFHFASFGEIMAYISSGGGSACFQGTSTGNTEPTVSAGSNYTIPRETPFTLTATGSDLDGHALTYCWEERDLGPQADVTDPDDSLIPLFRSWTTVSGGSRTFPRIVDLVANTTTVGEQLPTTDRTMNFRVTARDNYAGAGGVNSADMEVTVTTAAGPFAVTEPNTAVTWSGRQTVRWSVAGTDAAPINAAEVKILLSLDGGVTFPITLKPNTANDGEEGCVVMPNVTTSTARVKVRAVGNVFFDISDVDFAITPAAQWDQNGDGDVDMMDYLTFLLCVGSSPSAECLAFFDSDGDGDVDLDDYAALAPNLGGSMGLIHTVSVGNAGNAGELSGEGAGGYGPDRICGAVDYVYNIGRFEVTAGQYTEFLNAVAADDTYGLYHTSMWSNEYGCKIEQAGSSGSYTYSVACDWADRPVNYVSWGDAARFANWLHNGQPTGTQGPGTTEDGSYFLNGAMSDPELLAITREPDATWVIPSEDEWYKAAYHKNDGVTGNYWDFPTSNDSVPSNDLVEPIDPGNNATFRISGGDYTIGSPYWRTEAGAHENSDSPYDTFDQGGNVWEWNEAIFYGSYRGFRGGSFYHHSGYLHAAFRSHNNPTVEYDYIGFRVAEVP